MSTQLSFDISTSNNQKIIRLFDTSVYYKDQEINNYIVEVLPVNKSVFLTFNVTKNFSLVLNSSNLGYRKATSNDDLIDLPDGIYEFKQSFAPNIKTVSHFLHLRTTELFNKIQSERVKLVNDTCKISRDDFIQNRDKLRDIEEYLLAAKWMVEECLDKAKGKELYEYSKKLLEEYTNECQC